MSVRRRLVDGKPDPRYRKPWVATVDRGRDLEGHRLREERSFETRREALEWEREEYAAARSRKRMRSQLPTLGALLADWIGQGENLHDWSPRHLANCRWLIDGPFAPLAPVRIDRLETRHIEQLFVAMRRDGRSPHTVRLARNALRSALNLAVRRQLLTSNVARLAEMPDVPPRRPPTVLNEIQIQRFLECARGERLASFWLTSMVLALRPAEAVGLRWSDVDFEGKSVTIAQTIQGRVVRPTKTERERTIPLPAIAERALLTQQINQQWEKGDAVEWEESGLVFTNRSGGPVYEPYALRRLTRLLRDAELPHVTLYQLRHTGATLLMNLGVPLEQIREIMGHSTSEMTLGYARVSEELKRDAMSRLDAFFETGAPE